MHYKLTLDNEIRTMFERVGVAPPEGFDEREVFDFIAVCETLKVLTPADLREVARSRPFLAPPKVLRKQPRALREWLLMKFASDRGRGSLVRLAESAFPSLLTGDFHTDIERLSASTLPGSYLLWHLVRWPDQAYRRQLEAAIPNYEDIARRVKKDIEEVDVPALAVIWLHQQVRAHNMKPLSPAEAKRLQRAMEDLRAEKKTAEELLEQAAQEIETLQRQAEEERRAYAKILREYEEKIAALQRARNDHTDKTIAPGHQEASSPLTGLTVLVCGDDSHKDGYRQILEEEHGAVMSFVPGFSDLRRLSAAVGSADAVVYVAAYAAHKAQDQVLAGAEASGIPVAIARAAGLASFRRALEDLAAQLEQNARAFPFPDASAPGGG